MRRFLGTCSIPTVAKVIRWAILRTSLPAWGLDLGTLCSASRPDSFINMGTNWEPHTETSASYAAGQGKTPVCTVRGRIERSRGHGKLVFLHLRQPPLESIQVVCHGKVLAQQAKAITPESIVEVKGVIKCANPPVTSTTCANVELHASAIRVVSRSDTPLPFPLHDTSTRLETRLNHRIIDLRTPLTTALMRILSYVCQSFRQRLLEHDFIEVHTPKLIASASEGGGAAFEVKYFDDKAAYLAQSPQLYKQMVLAGDAMRVFEVGPVFRAEQSLTHRHLTEFVGLDVEMVIKDSYLEVLDVLEYVVCGVLEDLEEKHAKMLRIAHAALAAQRREDLSESAASTFPPAVCGGRVVRELPDATMEEHGVGVDNLKEADYGLMGHKKDKYGARVGGMPGCPRVLRMSFDHAVDLLRDNSDMPSGTAVEDFSLALERRLGQLIKMRYGVDVYVIDQFPCSARPFYTMPLSPFEPHRTRSFDLYLRGEEISSGSQRQDCVPILRERVAALGIDVAGLKNYMESFRYGVWPHGGFGLGLERLVAFYVGATDVRQASIFPRDPKRITP